MSGLRRALERGYDRARFWRVAIPAILMVGLMLALVVGHLLWSWT